jgi:hypothetical protein
MSEKSESYVRSHADMEAFVGSSASPSRSRPGLTTTKTATSLNVL